MAQDRQTLLDVALQHAQAGFRVFPLTPYSKAPPLIERWPELATTDPAQITTWWQRWPTANVGVATGRGVLVVDVDPAKGGFESLMAITEEHGPLPETYTVRTPGDGVHMYFAVDRRLPNTADRLGRGIDTRCDGGYVVAAGCPRRDGAYRADRVVPLAPLPMNGSEDNWYAETLCRGREEVGHADHSTSGEPAESAQLSPAAVRQDVSSVVDGERNVVLASLAGTMRRRGCSPETILSALHSHNMTNCHPPLDTDEVVRIAKSVGRYAPDPAASEPAGLWWGGDVPAEAVAGRIELSHLDVADLVDTPAPEVPMLLENLLPRNVVGTLVGTGGAGKTTLMVDMAASLACGKAFVDHYYPAEPVRVMVLIKEDDRDDLHRMVQRVVMADWRVPTAYDAVDFGTRQALLELLKRNLMAGSLLGRPTSLVTATSTKAEVGAFYGELRDLVRRACDATGETISALFLDPASRMRNANENDANAATLLVDILDAIRDEFGCTVILTHHMAKASTRRSEEDQHAARGSTAFVDGMRWAAQLTPQLPEVAEKLPGLVSGRDYFTLANTKNTRMMRAPSLLLSRSGGGIFESCGLLSEYQQPDAEDVRERVRSGSDASSRVRGGPGRPREDLAAQYDVVRDKVLEFLAAEAAAGRRYSRRALREKHAGTLEVAKARLYEYVGIMMEDGLLTEVRVDGRTKVLEPPADDVTRETTENGDDRERPNTET